MEIIVHPQAFSVGPTQTLLPTGEQQQGMAVMAADVGGTIVRVVFAAPDWAEFQKAVADHEAFAASMKARAQILGPDGLAPTLRQRKH